MSKKWGLFNQWFLWITLSNSVLSQQYGWYTYDFGVQPAFVFEVGQGSDALYGIGRIPITQDSVFVFKIDPVTFNSKWVKVMSNGTNRNWLMGGDVVNDTIYITTWHAGGDHLMLWELDSSGNLFSAKLWSRIDVQPGAMAVYPDGSILMSAENVSPYAALVRYFPNTGTFINNNWRVDGCSAMRYANGIVAGQGTNPGIYTASTCVYQQLGVAKFDANLNPVWIKSFHFPGQSSGSNTAGTVVRHMLTLHDRVYIVGDVLASVHGVGNGDRDLFIMALDTATGNIIWAFAYGGVGYDISYSILPSPIYNDRLIVAMTSNTFSSNLSGVLFEIDTSGAIVSDSGFLLIDTFSSVILYKIKEYNGNLLCPAMVNNQPAIAYLPADLTQINVCMQRVPINRVPITFNITNVWDTGSTLSLSTTIPFVRSDSISMDTICISQCEIRVDSTFDVSCFGGNDGKAFISYNTSDSPVTVIWSTGDTNISVNDSLTRGSYWVAIIGTQCSDTAFFTINQPQPITTNVLSENPFFCFPPNGWISVNVSGGTPPYSHSWSNGMTSDSIYNLPPGTYTDTIRDSNNCVLIITVTLDSPSTDLSYTYNVECYKTEPYTLQIEVTPHNGFPPYSIQWEDGSTSLSYLTKPDSIGITLSDSTNCLLYDTITISDPGTPSLQIIPQIDTVYYGDTIVLSLNKTELSNSWWLVMGDSIKTTQLHLSPESNLVIYAVGSDLYGCLYYDSAYIYLLPPKIFFPTVFTPNNDGVHDTFGPVMFGKATVQWRIYNRWGQLIFEGNENSRWDGKINGKLVSTDKYVLVAYIYESGTQTKIQKIVQDLYIVK